MSEVPENIVWTDDHSAVQSAFDKMVTRINFLLDEARERAGAERLMQAIFPEDDKNKDFQRGHNLGEKRGVAAERSRIREAVKKEHSPFFCNDLEGVFTIIDGDEKPEKLMDFEPDTTGAVHAPSYNQGVKDENERIRRGINVFDLPCKKVVMEVIEGDA